MYLPFYGLKRKPFQNSTNPSFFWLGKMHKEALAIFKYGILNNQGFFLLTGDVGTGKTTFVNALTKSLGDEVIVAKVPDPGLEMLDFMNYISHAFDMKKGKFTSKEAFLIHFGHFLNNAYAAGKKVLLIIDECQRLDSDLLKEIRKISNIEKNGTKLLNIILIGQNEFNDVWQKNKNRTRNQRVSINYAIDSLDVHETGEFVRHRLKIAGAEKDIFSPDALLRVYEFSAGIPRRINIICDHALLLGFVQETKTVTGDTVSECVKDLRPPDFSKEPITEPLKSVDSSDSEKSTELTPECLHEIGSTNSWRTVVTVILVTMAVFMITYINYPKEYRKFFYQIKNSGRQVFSVLQKTNTPNFKNSSEPHIEPASVQDLDPIPETQVSGEGPINLPVAKELLIENVGSAGVVSENGNTDLLLEVPTESIQTDDPPSLHPIERNSVVEVNSPSAQTSVFPPSVQQDIISEDITKKVPVSSETAEIIKSKTEPNHEETENIEDIEVIVIVEDTVLSPDVPVAETETTGTADAYDTPAFDEKKKGNIDSINKKTDFKVYSDFEEYMTQKTRKDLSDESVEPAEPVETKEDLNEEPEYLDPGSVIDWVLKKHSE